MLCASKTLLPLHAFKIILTEHSIRRIAATPCRLHQKRYCPPPPSQAHVKPYSQFLPTGNIFERRLLESYIRDNGTDPITAEPLTESDILDLQTSTTVKPRPPTLTSIPSLLSVFQNEWDALALETFTLRQHLTQTRQELSNALYENDAAKRVVARLQKERDEARDALSKIGVNGAGGGGGMNGGEAMQIDGQEMSEDLVKKVEATQEKYVCNLRFRGSWWRLLC